MTEFSPLGYIASLAVLALVVSYAWILQVSAAVRDQSWFVIGAPLQVFYWSAGKLAFLAAMALIPVLWGLYAITELWGPGFIYRFFFRGYQRLDKYCTDRNYCGGHRHGLAAQG